MNLTRARSEQGNLSDDVFYYVLAGQVQVIVDETPKLKLFAGSTFGENAFADIEAGEFVHQPPRCSRAISSPSEAAAWRLACV